MVLGMRPFICLICFFIFNVALVENTLAEDTPVPVEDRTVETSEEEIMPAVFEPVTQDIGGRLDKLEGTLNNHALLDMLELLESLKIEVTTLRSEIEVQTHTIDQLKQKQRDLYTDVDDRLQRIETKGGSGQSLYSDNTKTDTKVTEEQQATSGEENVAVTTDEEKVVATTDSEPKPEPETETENNVVATEEGKPVDPLKAEAVYQKAFKLLQKSQYDQAFVAFKDFLKVYPNSPFSDNAQYWLGEANYVTQKYELAINEYQALCNTYPDSKKVSYALLKIGYSYAELGNDAEAKKILKEVKLQYPGTTVARLANERLRKISSAEPKD